MKHFLITRFNLKNKHWNNKQDVYEVLSKEWLDDRFRLFETYCLPSVKNQENKNFNWLVFFDIDTPKAYLNRIDSIAKDFTNFKPVFIDGFENLEASVENQIRSTLSEADRYIITTRLDNDDVLHKNFIGTIQNLFVAKEKTVLDLRLGYQVIFKTNQVEYRVYKTEFNPFISLISDTNALETVISHEHLYWKNATNVIVNNTDFMWIQLIHNKNKLNQKLNSLKITDTINHKDFGIELPKKTKSEFQIFLYNQMMFPYRIYFNLKIKIKEILK